MTTTYCDRDEWTATDASGVTLTGAKLVGIAWHWPGTSAAVIGVESKTETAERLRGYRRFHVVGRGWRDIGYNVAFDQAGRVWKLRTDGWHGNLVGAHCASSSNPDANHEYVGCLLILGADEKPSAAMLAAIADWYWTRFLPRWPGRDDNRGHGQVAGASTTCQGPHVRAALADDSIPGTTTEDGMSWNENLNPTDLAASRFPDGYSKRAEHVVMHILGLAYHANWGKIKFNSWMQKRWGEQSLSPRVYLRSGYGHSREGKELVRDDVLPLLREIRAAQGSAERDQVLTDIQAELQAANVQRQELADALDSAADMLEAATTERADILALIQAVGSGERDAAEVVDEIARRLQNAG